MPARSAPNDSMTNYLLVKLIETWFDNFLVQFNSLLIPFNLNLSPRKSRSTYNLMEIFTSFFQVLIKFVFQFVRNKIRSNTNNLVYLNRLILIKKKEIWQEQWDKKISIVLNIFKHWPELCRKEENIGFVHCPFCLAECQTYCHRET